MSSRVISRSVFGVVVLVFAIGACGGGGGSAAPAVSTSPDASPAASSPAASTDASGSAAALPEECAAQIRAYLVAIEPIVANVDWQNASEVPPEIADQLDAAPFDPDLCPDISAVEAHAAWSAIATEVAPDAQGYIDFIYRP
jgi:hypothetical protein